MHTLFSVQSVHIHTIFSVHSVHMHTVFSVQSVHMHTIFGIQSVYMRTIFCVQSIHMHTIYLPIKSTRQFPTICCLRNAKLNHIYAKPPSCPFPFYHYIHSIHLYSRPWCSSTHNMYSKQYVSHLKRSHFNLFIIMNHVELKPQPSWCPLPPRSS
jgi:hypothetical protein